MRPRPAVPSSTGKDFDEVEEGEHRVRAEAALRSAIAELDAGVDMQVDAFVEDPADTLVRVSENLDLLVCGSRGYGPLRAVLLGGVSRRVVAEAHCPVIVLPRGVEARLRGPHGRGIWGVGAVLSNVWDVGVDESRTDLLNATWRPRTSGSGRRSSVVSPSSRGLARAKAAVWRARFPSTASTGCSTEPALMSPRSRPHSPAARAARWSSCAPRRARPRGAASARGPRAARAACRRRRPPAPCTWIARSMIRCAISGAATLIAAISVRACRLPTVSMSQAVFSVSSRTISSSIRASAIQSWTLGGSRPAGRTSRARSPAGT